MVNEPDQTTLELSELYCLGIADAAQVAEVESRLRAGETALAREIERLRPVTDAMLRLAPAAEPPAGARERLLAAIEGADADAARPFPIRAARTGGRAAAVWLALAASLVLAAVGWWPRLTHPRSDLLADYRVALANPRSEVWPVGAAGEWSEKGKVGSVVWNPGLQRAYLRLANVDTNNPTREQFQAWLFDASRDKYPVSGGVFDISGSTARDESGNYIIAIRPDLPVGNLAQFAVTIERPGGVVVTDAKRLVLAAKREGP